MRDLSRRLFNPFGLSGPPAGEDTLPALQLIATLHDMFEMMEDVYRAALHVMDEGTRADEMFIVTFDDKVELVSDFTSDRHRLENAITDLRAGRTTALYDAVARGLRQVRKGKHQKKVLVVVTDGEDNASDLSFRRLVDLVEEERDVLIYTVGMFDSLRSSWLLGAGSDKTSIKRQLGKLAEATGASPHFPQNVEQCRQAMDEIALEIGQQYSVGYYPANKTRDGKWRDIRVEVIPPKENNRTFRARTRTGYYAPGGEPPELQH